MATKKYFEMSLRLILVLGLGAGLMTGCNSASNKAKETPPIETQLLVRSPDSSLPVNKPINVKSLTKASRGVSHVELYAVELPTGQKNVLIRSDPAPSVNQPSFTVAQTFTPVQPGHYVIKTVGYNLLGQKDESDYLGFEVR